MYKQVIVVRRNLEIGRGKLSTQVAHASVGAVEKSNQKIVKEWNSEGAKKIVLKVSSEEELLTIESLARREKLPIFLVRDAGKTQLESGTITALGIGPDEESKIDKITGRLKLL